MSRMNVVRCVLVGCLLVGLLTSANAADRPRFTNQEQWQRINEADQLWYLKGLYDGAFLSEERRHYKDAFPQTTLGKMRKLLDKFYRDSTNHDIPVPHALFVIKLEQAGKSASKIKAFKKAIRELVKLHKNIYNVQDEER